MHTHFPLSPWAFPPELAILTVGEMTRADQAAARAGTPTLDLMEAAGTAVARLVQIRWPRRPVAVLCGPGNNGGDGFVVARLLAEAGWPVRLALFGDEKLLKGDAAVNARRWRVVGGVAAGSASILADKPLVIDALFGAGLNRALDGAARDAVDRINAENLACIAVDVPSGVNGDTGEIMGAAPVCTATVTFFRPKPAHFLYPAKAHCGDLTVADIGIPAAVLAEIAPRTVHNTPALWALPRPSWRDHKYARGSLIVVGGGEMTGAARLAGRAARRIGAGMLTFAVPPAAADIYAIAEAGALIRRIAAPADMDRLLGDSRHRGVLIGPGLGRGPEVCAAVLRVLASDKAVVLDADALSSFEDAPEPLFTAITARAAPVVMTPHTGEFSRLFATCGQMAAGQGKLMNARAAAQASGAVVVLKGPDTVVAAPDGRAALCDNAPPWLASGGTGDVLAGMVAGLLVQGMGGFEAACAGVWLHGAAGGACGRGLIAEDLPEALPNMLKSL
ncbi:MAG: NAD(P)H-hydrate dehydratase [Rhodospirillaceae bacterium]